MRRSEFDRAIADEFGDRGPTITVDLGLGQLGGRTAVEALDAGVATREVWLAICEETGVPATRRYGVGRVDARRR